MEEQGTQLCKTCYHTGELHTFRKKNGCMALSSLSGYSATTCGCKKFIGFYPKVIRDEEGHAIGFEKPLVSVIL